MSFNIVQNLNYSNAWGSTYHKNYIFVAVGGYLYVHSVAIDGSLTLVSQTDIVTPYNITYVDSDANYIYILYNNGLNNVVNALSFNAPIIPGDFDLTIVGNSIPVQTVINFTCNDNGEIFCSTYNGVTTDLVKYFFDGVDFVEEVKKVGEGYYPVYGMRSSNLYLIIAHHTNSINSVRVYNTSDLSTIGVIASDTPDGVYIDDTGVVAFADNTNLTVYKIINDSLQLYDSIVVSDDNVADNIEYDGIGSFYVYKNDSILQVYITNSGNLALGDELTLSGGSGRITWQSSLYLKQIGVEKIYISKDTNGYYVINRGDSVFEPNFSAFPTVGNASLIVTFTDLTQGDVQSWLWDFGDGTSSTNQHPTHIYENEGVYDVILNIYVSNFPFKIEKLNYINVTSASVASNCELKENYISICGPEMLGRYGSCRNINLVEYLPQYLRGGEAEQFLVLFEDFLNEMYPGLCGWQLSALNLPVTENYVMDEAGTNSANAEISSTYIISGDTQVTEATNAEEIQLHWPTNAAYHTSAQRISILEKVNRLTELHDPDLIDLEYIQFFASNLGYNINISRDEIGNSGTTDQFGLTEFQNECSVAEINRYLRFVVSNLPTWYKIKTTRNAIKVMLYSFGLVGDIIEYFTDSYKSFKNGGKWRINQENDFANIPKDWFPTPHFAIWVDIEKSSNISFDIQRRNKVVRAIESIRPVNTVFDKLYGYIKREIHLTAAGYIRYTRYKYISSNGYSNRKPIDGWS